MEIHRIKTKIGDAEFEAEGEKEVVTAQFEAFMAAVAALAKSPKQEPQTHPATGQHDRGNERSQASDPVPQSILDRVFRPGETLSLAALPSGEGREQDAMIALLYGYMKLKGETTVTGTSLNKSARISGVMIDRVDRVMSGCDEYILAGGVRKGRRYQLNNRGILRAEEIINGLLK